MAEDTIQIRAYKRDHDRIKDFGRAGDTIAQALSRALDMAEKYKNISAPNTTNTT